MINIVWYYWYCHLGYSYWESLFFWVGSTEDDVALCFAQCSMFAFLPSFRLYMKTAYPIVSHSIRSVLSAKVGPSDSVLPCSFLSEETTVVCIDQSAWWHLWGNQMQIQVPYLLFTLVVFLHSQGHSLVSEVGDLTQQPSAPPSLSSPPPSWLTSLYGTVPPPAMVNKSLPDPALQTTRPQSLLKQTASWITINTLQK